MTPSEKKSSQQSKANELCQELEKNGFVPSSPYTNESNFGMSTYVYFLDETGVQRKFRISDHSVTNLDRVLNEYHFSNKTDIKSFVESIKFDIERSKERARLFAEKCKAQDDRIVKLDAFWAKIKDNFLGLTFKKNNRTYQTLEQISRPERSAIFQKLVDPVKKAYAYEWAEKATVNEVANTKPSYDYIENIMNNGLI